MEKTEKPKTVPRKSEKVRERGKKKYVAWLAFRVRCGHIR